MNYGLELEGFYKSGENIVIPPVGVPTDGFPGLVEVRTIGASRSLEEAFGHLLMEYYKYPNVCFSTFSHTFSPAERQTLRRRESAKQPVNIECIYGSTARALGNKSLASFQISFSRRIQERTKTETGYVIDPLYGLFDFVPMIRKLDTEFSKEIKEAKRQPGFYAVKDGRVEYRSLPNFVFARAVENPVKLLKRIESCLNN